MLTPKLFFAAAFALLPLAAWADAAKDRALEEAARSSYTFQRVLNNEIDVKVRDGIATLSGRVGDMDQSRLAEDTVANIEGVRQVENQIRLDPKARGVSDEWLAVKIRSKLLLDRDISLMHTRVDVKEGVVTLTGTAESPSQKARTELAIKAIVGVRQVRNHLEIAERTADARRPADKGADPVEPALPAGAGLPTGRESASAPRASLRSQVEDTAITTQVKFQLLTNDATNALSPKVETTEGRVVITGDAETDEQRQLVTDIARRVRGVAAVENRMNVKRR